MGYLNLSTGKRRGSSALACVILLMLSVVPCTPVRAEKLSDRYPMSSREDYVVYETEPSYSARLADWTESGWETVDSTVSPIVIPGDLFTGYDNGEPQTATVEGKQCLVWREDVSTVEWTFHTEVAGLYVLQLEYYAIEGEGLPIQRAVTIDDESPFSEAGTLSLPRYFADAEDPKTNSLGDETRPVQEEIRQWHTHVVHDSQGKYADPLLWRLSEGDHTLRLSFIDQPVAIAALTFCAPQPVVSYAQKREEYQQKGYTDAESSLVIQAEDRRYVDGKTKSSIVSYNDGDPMMEPEGVESVRLNAIGGYNWREGNQEITYRITVEPGKAGLYKIAMRVQQGWGNGLSSYRQILLDGEVPFEEMRAYAFPYSRNWYTHTLSDAENQPYLFYLSEGEHTFTLTVKLCDEITQALEIMQQSTEDLSRIVRKITLITGMEPDPNYDYDLEKAIPELLTDFEALENELSRAIALITQTVNKTPSTVNNLKMTIQQFREMRQNPRNIHKHLNDMNSSLINLGDWMTDLQSSPLGLDTIGFYAPAESVPERRSGMLQKLWAVLRNFAASFYKDYNALGGSVDCETDVTLKVWISRGKEWGAVLQELIDADFTPNYHIAVNLNILPTGTLSGAVNPLLLSVNSGTAPDVVLSLANNVPVEYAVRGAVADLSQMPGFDEVKTQFDSKIFTPLVYRGGVYALPETTNFRVMFYRKDILSELQLAVPNTWDEVFEDILPVLYQNGMQMYIPSAYDMFLFQNGGAYYTEDGLRSALDTPEAFAAFERHISLYSDLGIPISASFFNRFRSGEMPIGIESYSQYITLLTAAPELTGKWGIALLPGTQQEGGDIDRSTAVLTGETDVIMQQSENQGAAWEFLRWWVSTPTQTRYAGQVEGSIGTYARWATANFEAFSSLPWNKNDLAVIQEQWQWSEDSPTVLGGSYTGRHLTNAFSRCLYNNESPRDSLEEAVEAINKELIRKQQLYGITEKGQ